MTANTELEKAFVEAWRNRDADPAAWERARDQYLAATKVTPPRPTPTPRPPTAEQSVNDWLHQRAGKNLIRTSKGKVRDADTR